MSSLYSRLELDALAGYHRSGWRLHDSSKSCTDAASANNRQSAHLGEKDVRKRKHKWNEKEQVTAKSDQSSDQNVIVGTVPFVDDVEKSKSN